MLFTPKKLHRNKTLLVMGKNTIPPRIAKSENYRVMEIFYFQMDCRVHMKNINKHKW